MGQALLFGIGVEQNLTEGAATLGEAAALGSALAAKKLGDSYYKGTHGVRKDARIGGECGKVARWFG